jgi:hypothetical protein
MSFGADTRFHAQVEVAPPLVSKPVGSARLALSLQRDGLSAAHSHRSVSISATGLLRTGLPSK